MVAAERFMHCVGAANLVWRVPILEHAFGAVFTFVKGASAPRCGQWRTYVKPRSIVRSIGNVQPAGSHRARGRAWSWCPTIR